MDLAERLRRQKTLPTLLPEDPVQALDDIACYRAAGHSVVEILMRTPRALEAIAAARAAFPGLVVGAGTVLTPGQADAAAEAGAQFIVSPATDVAVGHAARARGLPFVPGVCTPTDVAVALREGWPLQKLFPVELGILETLLPGRIGYLDALASPYGHTPLQLIAAYGVSRENFAAHLAHPLVAGVIAGWLYNLHGAALRRELAATLAAADLTTANRTETIAGR